MTYSEAIEALKPITEHDVYEDHFKDACKLAIKAMEKQIAKPVNWVGAHLDHVKGHCPVCGWKSTEQRGTTTYCEECGQKLKWQ